MILPINSGCKNFIISVLLKKRVVMCVVYCKNARKIPVFSLKYAVFKVLFLCQRVNSFGSSELLLKLTNAEEAKSELKRWLWKASHSRIPAFKELYQKIRRHKTHILNTIRYGMSNARIEATNNKIKLIIRKAYGFRNIQNMLDMVYLVCSDIRIPLPNRKLNAA